MSQQSYVYEYEAPDGYIYEIEGPEDMSIEDMKKVADSYQEPSPVTETQAPQQAPAPTPQGSGPIDVPAPQTVTQAEGFLINDTPRNPYEEELSGKASQLEQLISGGAPDEQVRQFVKDNSIVATNLETNLELRRQGKQTGGVNIRNPMEDAFQPQQPEDPGDRKGLERLKDGFNDAVQYGFNGWAARYGNDWFDTSKDQLRQAFPDRDEEWYEQMHDWAIVQTQKKLRSEAQMLQDMDPNWRPDDNFFQNSLAIERWGPWFLGQVAGSAGPESAIAPGASLAARAAAQSAIGATTDIAYQTGDILAGVEDELSLESVALNALMGAGGEAVLTGVARTVGLDSARGKGVNSTEVRNARFPRVLEELDETIPARTTVDRRTTAFRTETAAAGEAIADRVNVLTQDWTNAPEFEVHGDFRSVKDLDDDALGVYRSDGKVYLNTDSILDYAKRRGVSADDVVRSVVFHEGLGHHGLASRYGAELDSVMTSFYDQGDTDFRARVDNYMDSTGETDVTLATEETLAILSERGELPVRMMDRLVTFFRQWAREIPWIGSRLKFTDNEIRTLLAMSQRETISGARVQGGSDSDKYMVAYHGSRADFDRFDHSYMSTGEGNQAFGWGTYLTQEKQIAEGYRDMLSERQFTWSGAPYSSFYSLRERISNDAAKRFADNETQIAVDDVLTYMGSTASPSREGFTRWMSAGEVGLDKRYSDAFDFVNDRLDIKSEGKIYEVSLPDNAKFVEWEESLTGQPSLVEALESGGYRVTDYFTWNKLNRDAYMARTEYENLNAALTRADEELKKLEVAEEVDTPYYKTVEEEADTLFQRVQQAAINRSKAIDRAQTYFHDQMTGEDVYGQLTSHLGSDKTASEFLSSYGIQGNRYLADNAVRRAGRKGGSEDTFNYAIFDDKTPQIVNKYMKPRDLQDTTPLTADELSADELFDSMNAFDILNRITPDGERTVYNMEDLQSDAAARGVSPSALLKKATEGGGSLSKSLFMYDLAAQKMNERVTRLYGKIQSGQYTMRDKDNYIKTVLQFEDLTAKIFSQQSEVGRALRAIQEMEFTRNRVTTLRDVLRGLDSGLEGLDDPATFERFARQLDEKLRLDESNSKSMQNPVIQTLNVPRAVMSSMDLSAPLRQGLFFITKPAYWKAFIDMHTSFFSQRKYDAIMDDITSRPTYESMIKGRLAFSRIDEGAPLSAREEDFQTDLAAQLPIIGRGVKASNRAYSAFRNKLSADMFDHYYTMMQKSGMDMEDVNTLQGMSAFINAATGRGNLPQFLQSAGPQLNSVFFSPRLIMSRLNLLNPVFYYKLPPVVRREALVQAAAMGSLATLTLGTIDAFVPDAEVEFDPRHTDFGKVRVGNTRFDVLGGFAQFIRLGARLSTGRSISSSDRVSEYKAAPFIQGIHDGLKDLYEYSTGEAVAPSTPSNPAYAQTLKDSISQFLENKFSPNASYVNDMLKGENFIGEEFDPVDGALARVMPMYFQDMAELASEDGPGPITTGFGAVSSLYGVGSNTYVTSSLDTKQELEAPETMTDKDLADGENEWVTVSNGTIKLKPEAREMYENRLNNYFSQIMEYEMSQDNWSEIERSTQADIIKEAKAEARREARKDMRKLFGIE